MSDKVRLFLHGICGEGKDTAIQTVSQEPLGWVQSQWGISVLEFECCFEIPSHESHSMSFLLCVCADISLGQSGMPADIGGVLEIGP